MATVLEPPKIAMPVIPSSRTVRERLAEVLAIAAKLEVLLRVAIEMESIDEAIPPVLTEAGHADVP